MPEQIVFFRANEALARGIRALDGAQLSRQTECSESALDPFMEPLVAFGREQPVPGVLRRRYES